MPRSDRAGRPTGFVRERRLANGGVVFELQYRPHGRPDETPKTRRLGPAHLGRGRPKPGTYTRAQAGLELEKLLQQLDERPDPPAQELLFTTCSAAFLDHRRHEKRLAPDTLSSYGVIVAELDERFDGLTIVEIDEDDIEDYRSWLVRRGLAGSTINQRRAVLSGIFKLAKRRHRLRGLVDVLAAFDFAAVNDSEDIEVYDPEEVWALVRHAASVQDAVIFLVAAFCGLRKGELIGLRWRAIDFVDGFVLVRRQTRRSGDRLPKGKKVHAVPLPPQVAGQLDVLSRRDHHTGPDDRVFVGDRGGAIDPSALYRRYKAAQKAAGLRPLRFHDLRHTFGTLAVQTEAISDVQAYMGHKDMRTTRRYVHHKPKREAAERLGALIGGELDWTDATSTVPERASRGAPGERNSRARLTEEDVRSIRARLADGTATQAELAAEYGVATSTMAAVATRKTWSHVT